MHRYSAAPDLHYDRVSRAWRYLLGEDLHYGFFLSKDEPLHLATADLTAKLAGDAELTRGQSVLDVGCGVGGPAVWLAMHIGCRVLGISTSNEGLGEAERLASERRVSDQVEFRFGDGMDTGLPDAEFDRVWVMESSHLMPDKGRLLAECARVLRPQGRLALCDIILPQPIPPLEVLQCGKEFLLLERVFGEAKMETLATYQKLAEDAGLTVDSLEDVSEETYPTLARWRENAFRWRSEVTDLIGVESFDEFVAACDVLEDFWRSRRLGYGVMIASRRGA